MALAFRQFRGDARWIAAFKLAMQAMLGREAEALVAGYVVRIDLRGPNLPAHSSATPWHIRWQISR